MLFSNKKYFLFFAAILSVAGLYCFNPFVLYFQNDDFIHIPLSSQGQLLQHNSFRPICDLSIMLDWFLWHTKAWGYHLTNLLLHVADTILVYIFCKKLFSKYDLLNNVFEASLLVAILFFIYPNHSEAVFWISGRSASLGVLFFLLSLIFYLKREEKKYFLLSLLFSIIAWLTYESTWVLPFFFLFISMIDYKLHRAVFKNELIFFLLFTFSFLLYLITRFYFIHEVIGEYEAGGFLHFNINILLDNYATLMIRSWLPFLNNFNLQVIIFSVAAFTAGLFIFFQKEKKGKYFFYFIVLAWLVSLKPYASLGVDTYTSEGERFLYLPSVFCCMLISFFIFFFIKENIFKKLFSFLIIMAFVFSLNRSRINYVFAGNMANTILNEAEKIRPDQKIYITGLPQAQNGALIFSKGLQEAVTWINSNKDTVIINSTRARNFPLKNPYAIRYISCSDSRVEFNFTDSALIISKPSYGNK